MIVKNEIVEEQPKFCSIRSKNKRTKSRKNGTRICKLG